MAMFVPIKLRSTLVKIVINSDYGGFSLSDEAILEYGRLKGLNLVKDENTSWSVSIFYKDTVAKENYFEDREIPRNDPALVEVVEVLGEAANGFAANLKIVEIPEDVEWCVEENDGREWVSEKHRTWS
jgi:hypothetical protein